MFWDAQKDLKGYGDVHVIEIKINFDCCVADLRDQEREKSNGLGSCKFGKNSPFLLEFCLKKFRTRFPLSWRI